jgi:putative phage-type endonuclease
MNARQEWLQARRAGLGGSDLGAILGLSKYRTPVDVWMEKTGRIPGQDETLQMRFGSYAEQFVAQEYSHQTGRAVQRFTTMLHHPSAPILGNVDRLVIPEGAKIAAHRREIRTDRGLECKTASAFAALDDREWGPAGTDQVPPSYLVQCATYMALTVCTYWDLAVLFGNQEVRIYNLKRDAELEEEIIARAAEWWQAHVVADVPPEPTCEADVRALYPRDNGGIVVASEEVLLALRELVVLKDAETHLAEQVGDCKRIIQAAMGEAATLKDAAGNVLATWKRSKDSTTTDWKAVAAALNAPAELVAAHTHPKAGSRRFITKEL